MIQWLLLAYLFTTACVYLFFNRRVLKSPLTRAKIMVVIAHPDDEVMFFGPTMAEITRADSGNIVRVLCLSSGNHDGLGEIRKKELVASCKTFGIRETNVTILERDELKDGPNELWDPSLVGDQMNLFAKKHNMDTIITFDERGVSGHTNHIALYVGLTYFIQTFQSNTPIKSCYVLKSISLLRKYISVFDIPLTMLLTEALLPLVDQWTQGALGVNAADHAAAGSRGGRGRETIAPLRPQELMYVSSPGAVGQAKTAMQKHESQMVWFRKLYIVASRYMIVNDLRRVM